MNTITEIAPIQWHEIINHPPLPNPRAPQPRCFCAVGATRIGSATSDQVGDVLRSPDGQPWAIVLCHCSIEHTPDSGWVVIARTDSGEYLVTELYEFGVPTQVIPQGGEVELAPHRRTDQRGEMLAALASLYQRQCAETTALRTSAVVIPPTASGLLAFTEAGRGQSIRSDSLAERLTTTRERTVKSRKERTIVTARVKLPQSRAMELRLRVDEPLLPGLIQAPLSDLPQLVAESLSQLLKPRGLQAVYAGINLVMRAGTIELGEDGNFSDAFRLQVMDIIGMPSAKANATQRKVVSDALSVLIHAEIMVQETRTDRTKFIPMLMRASYYEADNVDGTRRAWELAINPLVLPEDQGGRSWLVPEALLQIPDEDDRDGTTRQLGFAMAHRVGMGSQGKSEKFQLLAMRAGCWATLVRTSTHDGPKYALSAINKSLHKLRAVPYRGGVVDIIGSTVIEGTTLGTAIVRYGTNKPTWAKSSS